MTRYQSVNPCDGKLLRSFDERFLAPTILRPETGEADDAVA